jgi:nucleoside-diphosphate-sugar epimerase
VARVLVEGATGALGGRIVSRFLAAGWEVAVGGRNPDRLAALAMLGAVRPRAGFRPDAIVNAAGIGGGTFDIRLLKAANVDVLPPLIAHARHSGALLIQLSTPATQFRFEDRLGIREDEPFSPPISPYAASKQAAERLIRDSAAGLRFTILRLRSGYGHGAPSMVESLRAKVRSGRIPLVNDGRAVIDLVHSDDIADAVLAVAGRREAMAGVTANIAGPEGLSFRAIVETLAAADHVSPRYVPVPAFAVRGVSAALDAVWRVGRFSSEPPLTRHVAGSLIHSQTLDLSVLKQTAGFEPRRHFSDHAGERAQ